MRALLVTLICSAAAVAIGQSAPVEDLAPPPALTEPAEAVMNNRRLGRLLKKHFPEGEIAGGAGAWQITLPEEPANEGPPAEANGAPAEAQPEEQLERGPGAGERLPPLVLVLTDERADRMRIMMPIRKFDPERLEDLQLALIALQANYDRALDARYAVQDGVLWSAFIHPLSSLTAKDLASAVRQVQGLRDNTGTTYSSGELLFAPRGIDPEGPDDRPEPPTQDDPSAV